MTLIRLGFFREHSLGRPDDPSLEAAIGKLGPALVGPVARYLDEAMTLAVASGPSLDDVLNPEHKGIAAIEIATDGRWMWPRDLGYYVRQYQVDVPDEFVDRVLSLGGAPPLFSPTELEELERD